MYKGLPLKKGPIFGGQLLDGSRNQEEKNPLSWYVTDIGKA